MSKHSFKEYIEGLFVEINFRKSKWILAGMYNLPSQPDQYFFGSLNKDLDVYCNYEKVVLVGDFNYKIWETCLDNFLFQHELQSINKEPTCLKNAHNSNFIDFMLTRAAHEDFSRQRLYSLDYQIFIN